MTSPDDPTFPPPTARRPSSGDVLDTNAEPDQARIPAPGKGTRKHGRVGGGWVGGWTCSEANVIFIFILFFPPPKISLLHLHSTTAGWGEAGEGGCAACCAAKDGRPAFQHNCRVSEPTEPTPPPSSCLQCAHRPCIVFPPPETLLPRKANKRAKQNKTNKQTCCS